MLDELLQRKLNIDRIQALADEPAPAIPNLEMSHEQQGQFIAFLQDMLREKDSQMRDLLTKFEEINGKLTESLQNQKEGGRESEETRAENSRPSATAVGESSRDYKPEVRQCHPEGSSRD